MKYDLYGPLLKRAGRRCLRAAGERCLRKTNPTPTARHPTASAGDEMGDGIASIVPVFGGFAFKAVPALAIVAGAVHWAVGIVLLAAALYGARVACVSSEAADKVGLVNRAFGVAVGLCLGPHAALALGS